MCSMEQEEEPEPGGVRRLQRAVAEPALGVCVPMQALLASGRWRLHRAHPFSEALLLARPVTAQLHFLLLSWSEGPCPGAGAGAEHLTLLLFIGTWYKEGKVERFLALLILLPHVSHFPVFSLLMFCLGFYE